MNTDHSDRTVDKSAQLLQENQIDPSVDEGLRLLTAFKKIMVPSDRRLLIELAERLAS
ncbi:hypothetical protein [Bradyrhizobium sp.]|uniref:hypothetical protein n=1 Tax=Bradyrhizobium sp. TaxID=376 RepID=UPI003C1FFB82